MLCGARTEAIGRIHDAIQMQAPCEAHLRNHQQDNATGDRQVQRLHQLPEQALDQGNGHTDQRGETGNAPKAWPHQRQIGKARIKHPTARQVVPPVARRWIRHGLLTWPDRGRRSTPA